MPMSSVQSTRRLARRRAAQPSVGLGLVDRAVQLDRLGVLAHPSAEEETGRAVVAVSRVDLHGRQRSDYRAPVA